jgi:hypothetical protein
LPEPTHSRDHRIDLFRGLALVMIFINHIPGTIWENVTSRNFGFSDAAEGFVLMSGIAAGLAYGPAFLRSPLNLRAALRPWRRAFTIWWVHCIVIFCIFAMFWLTIAQPLMIEMSEKRNILLALKDPLALAGPLVFLGHQFAYADILPLYIVLLLAAPAILYACANWPKATMLASVLLWFVVGVTSTKMPTFPTPNGWSFNPLAWQILFVAGVLTGLAMRRGQRLLPINTWALRLAIGFVIFAAIWVQVPAVAAMGGHSLWILHEYLGVPNVFTAFDKSYVFLPRLLHILALSYVLSALPWVKTLAANPKLAPLTMLGRHSLPVFAVGSVLAYGAQITKKLQPPSTLLDTVLILCGLCILFLVAYLRDGQKGAKTTNLQPATK